MQDPKVQAALLRHPAVSSDPQVVLALLPVSKQVQAVVAKLSAGQVPAAVRALHLRQALSFAQCWLPKYGGLLSELHVQLGELQPQLGENSSSSWKRSAVDALAAALDHQQRIQGLHLGAFSLRGAPAEPILWQVPAARLTRLCVSVDDRCRTSSTDSILAALSRLTALHSLDLSGSNFTATNNEDVFTPIAGLLQLAELCIGPLTLHQLQRLRLPPLLQHLDVAVSLLGNCGHLMQLGDWLEQHGSIVRRLKLIQGVLATQDAHAWAAAVEWLVRALQRAGSTPPGEQTAVAGAAAGGPAAPAAAATTTAGTTCSQTAAPAAEAAHLQLQSFVFEGSRSDAGSILQVLPASMMTHLRCTMDCRSDRNWDALGSFTALQRLRLDGMGPRGFERNTYGLMGQPFDVLARLSGLEQLTELQLEDVRPAQLQSLPAWLQVLKVCPTEEQLQLGHLTALSALHHLLPDTKHALRLSDTLPPNLRVLEWPCCDSIQPLLALNCLESVRITREADMLSATELRQLSNLPRLADLQLAYQQGQQQHTAVAAAWSVLPLKSLELHVDARAPSGGAAGISAAVVQQLSALQGLTRLLLHGCKSSYGGVQTAGGLLLEATPAQFAAALQHLTAVRVLDVRYFTRMLGDINGGAVRGPQHSFAGVAAIVDTLNRLPSLTCMWVTLPVRLDPAAQQQLRILAWQQLPLDWLFVNDCAGLGMVVH